MSAPSETGRFWLCPECKRHVSVRSNRCICGFDRTTVPVEMREVSSSRNLPPATRSEWSLRGRVPAADLRFEHHERVSYVTRGSLERSLSGGRGVSAARSACATPTASPLTRAPVAA